MIGEFSPAVTECFTFDLAKYLETLWGQGGRGWVALMVGA